MDALIKDFLEQFGAVGVGVLMLLENVFPPIPSEVVMPWAGYAVRQGDVSFVAVVIAGSIGSFAGALLWYGIARWIGKQRLAHWIEGHGAWLTITPADLDRVERWFQSWGPLAVLVGRMIPGLRTLISVPAGFAAMPIQSFSAFTAIGTVMWTTLLAGIGWWLGGRYEAFAGVLGWISTAVVSGLLAVWVWRLMAQHNRKRSN